MRCKSKTDARYKTKTDRIIESYANRATAEVFTVQLFDGALGVFPREIL